MKMLQKNNAIHENAKTNRLNIEANSSQIYARREEVEANRALVKQNSEKIAKHAFH